MELQSPPNLEILWKGNSKIVVSYSCGCDLVLRPRSLFFTVPLLLLLLQNSVAFSDFSTPFTPFFANNFWFSYSFLFLQNQVAFSDLISPTTCFANTFFFFFCFCKIRLHFLQLIQHLLSSSSSAHKSSSTLTQILKLHCLRWGGGVNISALEGAPGSA